MKITKNFDLREFIPPAVWKQFGPNSIWFLNPAIPIIAQFEKELLSKHYGEEVTVVINNWHYGGGRKWSGLRTYKYINQQIKAGKKTATLSQHIGGMCNAYDAKYYFKKSKKEIPANEVRSVILTHEKEFMKKGLTTLEGSQWAPTWVHHDCRPTGKDYIFIMGHR